MNQDKEIKTETETTEDAPATSAVDESSPASTEEDMQQQFAAAMDEVASLQDQFLRAKADVENIRRRAETDLSNAHKFAIERFAGELLVVKDSLELAQAVDIQAENADALEKMQEGLTLTLRQLESVFERFALTTIDPQGEKFDPERHQAMTMVESQEVAPNHIVEVVQKGYLLHDRVIRPAMVVVAKAATESASPPTE